MGISFKVSGYVREDGQPLSGVAVSIYVDGSYVTGATTDAVGYYSKNIWISNTGLYTLKASALGVSASRTILIYYVPYVFSVTISAPSSAQTGQSFTVSGQVKDQYGYGYGGITVKLYKSDSLFASIFTDSGGYYSKSTSISTAGTYTLKAVADSKQATRSITVTLPLPYVNTVTISAPSSVDVLTSFTVSGYVKDQYGNGMGGVSVSLYRDSASIGSATTSSSGYYSKSTSISTAGTYTLKAVADSKQATRSITIVAPVGIPTTTTISAPSKAAINEKFYISGILYETGSGTPIPGQPINHSYDGRSLGSSTTGVDGNYLKEVSIPESGVWIIKSEFLGTPGYAASSTGTEAIVAASPLEAEIKIAGSVAVGLALTIYSLS